MKTSRVDEVLDVERKWNRHAFVNSNDRFFVSASETDWLGRLLVKASSEDASVFQNPFYSWSAASIESEKFIDTITGIRFDQQRTAPLIRGGLRN